ncbi:MAG: UDP-N-acetylglucosamine 2-epimerase (non-hydrolyzing) [Acidobacteriota bacterium]
MFLVGGARPNWMKLAPLYRAFTKSSCFAVSLVHTGQHYDDKMAGSFFRELGLPDPDIALSVGAGSHGAQTARILEKFEAQLIKHEPDLVVVVGDVNSTIACALATAKMVYPDGRRPKVAHVEAGLRSGDRTMPEEVNRVLTDAISDYLFVTEQSGVVNLQREGRPADIIFLVGNVMIDTLLSQADQARERAAWTNFGVDPQNYAIATLHRPANVDDDERLRGLVAALRETSHRLPVVFPVHPRTRQRLDRLGLGGSDSRLILCEPQPYVDFLSLLSCARMVLTDSGGIQEETTILGVPCLTLRENTERPITVAVGTNRLIGTDFKLIVEAVDAVLAVPMGQATAPPLWDGKAAERIVALLASSTA